MEMAEMIIFGRCGGDASMGRERAEDCLEQEFRSQWTVVYTHNTP